MPHHLQIGRSIPDSLTPPAMKTGILPLLGVTSGSFSSSFSLLTPDQQVRAGLCRLDSRADLTAISVSHKWSGSGIVGRTHWKRKEALRPIRRGTAFEHPRRVSNMEKNPR